MTADRGGDWAYLSLVSALSARSVSPRRALLLQFAGFEAAAVALAAAYGGWAALPVATAAILVSTLGSGLMMALGRRLRSLDPPARYRALLFESSVDVVMGLLGFVALATYLVVGAAGTGAGPLERLLGARPPAPAVFLALLVAWDLCYRVGLGWWAGVTGLWRELALGSVLGPGSAPDYARADLLTLAYAGLQLLLVPFLWPLRPLALLLVGHVLAVAVVSGLSVGLGRRRAAGGTESTDVN